MFLFAVISLGPSQRGELLVGNQLISSASMSRSNHIFLISVNNIITYFPSGGHFFTLKSNIFSMIANVYSGTEYQPPENITALPGICLGQLS